MKQCISKCLLAFALVQGLIPADHCVLKLAGLCNCGEPAAISAPKCCCCKSDGSQNSANHNPTTDERKNPCCAYTPAHALTATAPDTILADAHQNCLATAAFSILECVSAGTTSTRALPSAASAHHPDTPVFLRVHAFLI